MGLREELYNLVRDSYPNAVSYDRVENFIKERGHKVSYGERVLRDLCEEKDGKEPNIKALKPKGYIMSYIYIYRSPASVEIKTIKEQDTLPMSLPMWRE